MIFNLLVEKQHPHFWFFQSTTFFYPKEYEISDIKIYRTEPKQKNAKTFFSVPAERFDCSDFLAMINSCYQYYIEI